MTIGSASYPVVGEFVISSIRGVPLTLLNAKVPLGPAKKGDTVVLSYGYASPAQWRGEVVEIAKGGDIMTVSASMPDELKLCRSIICESFIDETAEAIIKAALSVTGLPVAKIDSTGAQIARYTADSISVRAAVFQVQETLSLGHGLSGYALWLGEDGLVWSTDDRPGNTPEIVSGQNLVDHAPSYNDLSHVTTFMLPGFLHSQRFTIKDTRRSISGTFRASRVFHELKELSARTHIFYRSGE